MATGIGAVFVAISLGSDELELQPATRQFLEGLTAPLHLQVFVMPSCPYCPRAVVLAHRLACASPYVTADAVEVTEFPELGDRYQVMGVPRTVIDEVVLSRARCRKGCCWPGFGLFRRLRC